MYEETYFEIRASGNRIQLRVHPPEKGKKANLAQIQKELRNRDVSYRPETLFEIYRRASDEFEPLAVHEMTSFEVRVDVSEDAHQATITVTAPEVGEEELTPTKIKEALESAKVEKGIRYDVIKKILLSNEGVDGVLIAEGRKMVPSEDGLIQFEEKEKVANTVDENTADFRELDLIDNVMEGDLIAIITFPVHGNDGYNVHAKVLKARPGKKAKFKMGRNVRLSEDGLQLYATKNGYVVRTGSKVSVENILEVNNVDAETGNVRFQGVVRVKGQVEDSFSIDAEKGIEVNGTVGKAILKTRGDIKVRGGAIGAKLECEGNLYARFLSEVEARVGDSVVVDEYILHSKVIAKRSVRITNETKGFINGGRIHAGTEIWSPVVGSEISEEHTALEVGSSGLNLRKQFDALQERIEHNLENFDKLRKNLIYLQKQRLTEGKLEGHKKETYDTMVQSGRRMCDELIKQGKQHHELMNVLADPQAEGGGVFVSSIANPGTTVQIQTGRVNLRDPMESCAFMMLTGGLKAMPYGAALKLHKQNRRKQAQSGA